MALQLKLKNTNTVNEAGTRVYLTDDTGVYSLTNLGGYGAPNALRSTLALLLLPTSKGTKGDVLVSTEPYNPLTTGIFNVMVGNDGWYVFQLVALPLYDVSLLPTYNVNDVLYDASSGNIFKIIQTTAVVTASPVTTPSPTPAPVVAPVSLTFNNTLVINLQDLVDSTYVQATIDTLFIANNSKTKLRINTVISDLISNKADFTDKRLIRQKDNYNAVRSILQGAIYEFCRGNKFVAQKDIEFLNNNNYVLD